MKEEDKYIVFDIETTSLLAQEDVVTCICAKTSCGEVFRQVHIHGTIEEVDLIDNFLEFVTVYAGNGYKLVSKNGRGFDIPFILLRAYFNGLSMNQSNILVLTEHVDIQDVTSKRVSLQSMCELFALSGKTLDNAKGAIKLWYDGEYETLSEYCMNDVEMTECVYLILKESGALK